jgi:hypothetical protein
MWALSLFFSRVGRLLVAGGVRAALGVHGRGEDDLSVFREETPETPPGKLFLRLRRRAAGGELRFAPTRREKREGLPSGVNCGSVSAVSPNVSCTASPPVADARQRFVRRFDVRMSEVVSA